MNTTAMHYRYATAAIAVLIIIACLFLWYRRAGEEGMGAFATSTATSTMGIDQAALEKLPIGGSTTTANGYTIERVALDNLPKAPDFAKPLTFTADLTADARAFLTAKWQAAVDALKANPHDPNAWLSLGSARKIAGDYAGAAAAWEYLSVLSPQVPVAFNNLGDLYMNFLKNYPKSEANYLKAIVIEPHDPSPYLSLFTLYSNFYKKGTGAAEAIALKGLKANPLAVNLQVVLARTYRAAGKTSQADSMYLAAIKNAQSQGQTTLADQIQAEARK